MGVKSLLGEQFQDWLWEKYFSEEFVEHQLDELNAL
jgi:hypothetical protein